MWNYDSRLIFPNNLVFLIFVKQSPIWSVINICQLIFLKATHINLSLPLFHSLSTTKSKLEIRFSTLFKHALSYLDN